jgi:hypothetical protein
VVSAWLTFLTVLVFTPRLNRAWTAAHRGVVDADADAPLSEI